MANYIVVNKAGYSNFDTFVFAGETPFAGETFYVETMDPNAVDSIQAAYSNPTAAKPVYVFSGDYSDAIVPAVLNYGGLTITNEQIELSAGATESDPAVATITGTADTGTLVKVKNFTNGENTSSTVGLTLIGQEGVPVVFTNTAFFVNNTFVDADYATFTGATFTNNGLIDLNKSTFTASTLLNAETGATINISNSTFDVDDVSNGVFVLTGTNTLVADFANGSILTKQATFSANTKIEGTANITFSNSASSYKNTITGGASIEANNIVLDTNAILLVNGAYIKALSADLTNGNYTRLSGDNTLDIKALNGSFILMDGAELENTVIGQAENGSAAFTQHSSVTTETGNTISGTSDIDAAITVTKKMTVSGTLTSARITNKGNLVATNATLGSAEKAITFTHASSHATTDLTGATVIASSFAGNSGGTITVNGSKITADTFSLSSSVAFNVSGENNTLNIKTASGAGAITLQNGAKVKDSSINSGGKFVVNEGSSVYFTGTNSLSGATVVNSGTVYINGSGSTLSVKSIDGTVQLASSLVSTDKDTYQIISGDVSNANVSLAFTKDNYKALTLDSGAYITKIGTAELVVDSAYSKDGDVINDYYIVGYNAFGTFADALAKISENTTAISIAEAGLTEQTLPEVLTYGTFSGNAEISGGNVAFTGSDKNLILRTVAGSTLTIKSSIAMGGNNFVLNYDEANAARGSVTIDAAAAISGNEIQIDGNATVNGTLTATSLLWLRNGKSVVTTATTNAIALKNEVEAETVLISSGKVTTTADADVSATSLIVGNLDDNSGVAANIVSNGADWTFASNMLATGEHADSLTLEGGSIEFKGGKSSIKIGAKRVADDTVLIENKNFTLTLDGADMTAKKVSNAGTIEFIGTSTGSDSPSYSTFTADEVVVVAETGKFNVSGTSTLKGAGEAALALTGTIDLAAGTTLIDTKVSGGKFVAAGNLVFDGANTIGDLDTTENYAGEISIDTDDSLTAKDININSTGKMTVKGSLTAANVTSTANKKVTLNNATVTVTGTFKASTGLNIQGSSNTTLDIAALDAAVTLATNNTKIKDSTIGSSTQAITVSGVGVTFTGTNNINADIVITAAATNTKVNGSLTAKSITNNGVLYINSATGAVGVASSLNIDKYVGDLSFNGGTLGDSTFGAGSSITVNGSNVIAANSAVNLTVSADAPVMTVADNYTLAGGEGAKVVLNGSFGDDEPAALYKVIAGKVAETLTVESNVTGYDVFRSNDGIYLAQNGIDETNIIVDSTVGTVPNVAVKRTVGGVEYTFITGYNAFTSFFEAINAAKDIETTETISITLLTDSTDTKNDDVFYPSTTIKSNILVKGEGENVSANNPWNIDFAITAAGCDLCLSPEKTLTFDDTVAVYMTDKAGVWFNYVAGLENGNVVLNSTVDAVRGVFFRGAAEVNNFVSTDGNFIVDTRDLNKAVEVTGFANLSTEKNQLTVANELMFRSGTLTTEDTFVSAKYLGFDDNNLPTWTLAENPDDTENTPTAPDTIDFNLKSENTTWTISNDVFFKFHQLHTDESKAVFEFTDSTITVGGSVYLSGATLLNDMANLYEAGTKPAGERNRYGYFHNQPADERAIPTMTFDLDDSDLLVTGKIANAGTITATGASTITASAVQNYGTFTVTGTAGQKDAKVNAAIQNFGGGTMTLTDTVVSLPANSFNRGSLTATDSTLTLYKLENDSYGSVLNATGTTFNMTNNVSNVGMFTTNGGAINAKVLTNAPGGPSWPNNKFSATNTDINVTFLNNTGKFEANGAAITGTTVANSGTMELVNVALTGTTVAGKINVSGANAALNIGTKGTPNTGDTKNANITFNANTTLAAGSGIYTTADLAGNLTVNEGVALGFGGDFEAANEALSNAGTITVNGKLYLGAITSVGSILMDGGDYLDVYGAVTGKSGEAPNEAFTGTITINDTAFTANKVLVQAGLGGLLNTKITINNQVAANGEKITVGTGADAKVYTIALSDTSLALVEAQTKATLYVNKDYTPTSCDHVFGYNAFDNLGAAVANMDKTETAEKTTVIEVASSKDVAVTAGQDLTVSAVAINAKTGNAPSVTIGFSGADKGLYLESGVSINGVDITTTAANGDAWTGTVYVNKAAANGTVELAGNITAAGHIYFNSSATVTGNLTTTGAMSQILLRSGKAAGGVATITGSSVSSKWIVLISGETQITDSTITINALGYDNYAATDAAPVLISDNTTWTITEFVNLANTKSTTTPVAATYSFTNKSVINVAQNVALGSFITMNITGSTMTVTDDVDNAGKLNVSGKVLKNNTTEVVDNLKAAAITNSGLLSVTGDATVEATGAFTNTGVSTAAEGEAQNKGISLNAASLNVGGKLTNEGTFNATSSAITTDLLKNTGAILLDGNTATITVNGTDNYNGALENTQTGTITLQNGATLTATHTSANYGTISVLSGSTLNGYFNTVGAINVNGGVLKGSVDTVTVSGVTGTITVSGESTLDVNVISASSVLTLAGATLSGAKVTGNGTTNVTGTGNTLTGVSSFGDLSVAESAILSVTASAANSLVVSGDFTNKGAVTLSATAADVMTVAGTFSNTGTITITAAPEMATFESKRIIAASATDFGTITVSAGLAAQGYQVMVKNEGEGEGVYLFKNDKPVVRETIAVNLMWYDKTYGQDLIFGQDDEGQAVHYRFGVDAFQNANEVINLTAETTEIKFASNLNTYGDLTLTEAMNISVWSTDGLTKGGNLVLDNLTIDGSAETKLIDVNLDAAGTNSVGRIKILESATITGAEVDFDGGYIVFGVEGATPATVLTVSGSRINCDEKSKALTTTVYGNVVIEDASDVDFDDAATIDGNVTIGNTGANAAKSEVEFDRDTEIKGALTLYANSVIEADQGYQFEVTGGVTSTIDGFLKVDTEKTGSTDANLGKIAGTGTIYTDVDSKLSLDSDDFYGTISIDVTGLEKVSSSNPATEFEIKGLVLDPTLEHYARIVATRGEDDKGVSYAKYFTYDGVSGLKQLDRAANVYEATVSWAIGGDKDATQAAINAAVTGTGWNTAGGADAPIYFVDNVTLNGDIAYENKDTSLKSVYLGVNNGQNVILDGNFGAAVYGGKEYTATTGREGTNLGGDIYITVDGGTYSRVVVGGDRINVSSGRAVYFREDAEGNLEDITLTIEGGLFKNYVAAGVLYQGENLQGSVEVGSTNLVINGGTFVKDVYGGNYGNKKAASSCTYAEASNVTLTVGGAQTIEFQQALFVGSFGSGKLETTTLTLTGKSTSKDALKATEIWGGGSSDYYKETATSRTYETAVSGARTLSFTGFDATVNCDKILGFSDVIVKSNDEELLDDDRIDTNATLSDKVSLSDVSNWTFEAGSTLAGAFKNDFAGDTLALGGIGNYFAATKLTSWTLFSDTTNFTGFDSFAKDKDGDYLVTFDGDNATYSNGAWVTENYKLSIDDTSKAMVLSARIA